MSRKPASIDPSGPLNANPGPKTDPKTAFTTTSNWKHIAKQVLPKYNVFKMLFFFFKGKEANKDVNGIKISCYEKYYFIVP